MLLHPSCQTCGLRVGDQLRGKDLAAGPRYRTTLDWVGGEHPSRPSRESDFMGQRRGWQCWSCRWFLKPNSQEAGLVSVAAGLS